MVRSFTLFQSTPPCGGDAKRRRRGRAFEISIHAPLRGRPLPGNRRRKMQRFQSTPPCGGDKKYSWFWFHPGAISIHAPLRGRLVTNLYEDRVGEFQSTPPCGGDRPSPLYNEPSKISIHAPLRGRLPMLDMKDDADRFQSTPPCGGDRMYRFASSYSTYFNPRPLAGATESERHWCWYHAISIHAPLRGRPSSSKVWVVGLPFQSTPPCGGDSRWQFVYYSSGYFNPRPLAGATHVAKDSITVDELFQSTPPCGGDLWVEAHCIATEISIHAPLRGRRGLCPRVGAGGKFQSTPPCGGDLGKRHPQPDPGDFNPRPLAGATSVPCIWV